MNWKNLLDGIAETLTLTFAEVLLLIAAFLLGYFVSVWGDIPNDPNELVNIAVGLIFVAVLMKVAAKRLLK
jgi:hypothetical protein